MNPLLKFVEKKFAVFAILLFTDVLACTSYYNASEGSAPSDDYVTSPLDRPILLMQFAIYVISLILIILRFKSVVRPALRDPFLWALMAMIVTSFIWSDFPDDSQKYGSRTLFTTFFGLYLASRFSLEEQLRIVAWAVGIAAVFSLLYTLALPGSGIENGLHVGAWRGPLIHKNMFSRLMVASTLPLLLVALNSPKYRALWWTVFGIAVALIVLSDSKTALVIFLNLMVLVPCYRALQWSNSALVPLLVTLVLILGSVSTWFLSNWDSTLVSLGKDPTLSGRTDIWDAVIDAISLRPWLGYGFAAFWQDEGGGGLVSRAIKFRVVQAHNGFLNMGAELGFLGLLFFILSMIFTYIRAIKWARLGKTSEALWPVIYVTFLPLYNYSETTTPDPNSLFWVLFVAISLSLKPLPVVNPYVENESFREGGWVEHV